MTTYELILILYRIGKENGIDYRELYLQYQYGRNY